MMAGVMVSGCSALARCAASRYDEEPAVLHAGRRSLRACGGGVAGSSAPAIASVGAAIGGRSSRRSMRGDHLAAARRTPRRGWRATMAWRAAPRCRDGPRGSRGEPAVARRPPRRPPCRRPARSRRGRSSAEPAAVGRRCRATTSRSTRSGLRAASRIAGHTAQREPDEVRALDAEPVEQADDVVGEVVDRVRTGRDGRFAVAAGVVADDPEVLARARQVGVPHRVGDPSEFDSTTTGRVGAAGDDVVDRRPRSSDAPRRPRRGPGRRRCTSSPARSGASRRCSSWASGGEDPGAGRADRVAERDARAVRVEAVVERVDLPLAQARRAPARRRPR